MPPKKEICRYFQRGSCQYGTRCKFLHPAPQQSQSNPFGFGAQTATRNQQQPVSNPFGFGVQNNTQSRGGDAFGSKPNQAKPFENKWSRFSPINNSSAPASKQSATPSSAANHKCTDPETCKRMILEDLEHEKPLWKLTCYGHSQNAPCDIFGDISYDELRALAYDDAKQGKSVPSIVERERNMLNSKLIEFQNLAQKPHTASTAPTPSFQNLFGIGSTNAPVINNGFSSQVSSFSQLSGSLNTRSSPAPNFSFGQQSNAFQNNSQPSSFQTNNSPFNTSGAFSNQPQHAIQSFSSFATTSPNNGATSAQRNPFSTLASFSQTGNGADKQSNFFSNEPSPASSATGQTIASTHQLINSIPKENTNGDGSVWQKAEWIVGEIPEEEPPAIYIH